MSWFSKKGLSTKSFTNSLWEAFARHMKNLLTLIVR